jgi:hypothetical protein
MDVIKLLKDGLVKAEAVPIIKGDSGANWKRLMAINNIEHALDIINLLIKQENNGTKLFEEEAIKYVDKRHR